MCLIGATKTHSIDDRPALLEKITRHIDSEKTNTSHNSVAFVPREKTEKVKNCTKIDRKVQQQFVMAIVEKLLENPVSGRIEGRFQPSFLS